MRRMTLAFAASLCLAGLVSACGGSDGSPSAGGGTSANGTYGTGLELGSKVLSSTPVGVSVEPWYRWNGKSCKFEIAEEHPAEYKADIRPVVGGESRIGYMHYGNSDPFGVDTSQSVEAVAKKVGMPLDVYNLKYPSRTEPLSAANSAVVKQDKGVMQANLDTTVLPGFHDVLEKRGCIPSIQLYIPIPGRPAMGNHWPDVGKVIGTFVAKQAKARGWKPEDTALVQCTDPDSGPAVNELFEQVPKTLADDGFTVPQENVFDLVCKLTESQAGYKRVTDWLTSHPDFKHVALTAIDSIRMQEMIRAVERDSRPDEDSILAAGADDESSRHSVRAGQQDMSVAFFGERYGEWLIPMIQDLMAGNAVPSFVGTELVPLTEDNIDEYYPSK
jgi:ribose transport system substrate-binding protein